MLLFKHKEILGENTDSEPVVFTIESWWVLCSFKLLQSSYIPFCSPHGELFRSLLGTIISQAFCRAASELPREIGHSTKPESLWGQISCCLRASEFFLFTALFWATTKCGFGCFYFNQGSALRAHWCHLNPTAWEICQATFSFCFRLSLGLILYCSFWS